VTEDKLFSDFLSKTVKFFFSVAKRLAKKKMYISVIVIVIINITSV